MFILDTNVVSQLRRPDKAHRNVGAWLARSSPTDFFLSVITLFELEIGALRMGRNDPQQGEVLRIWIDSQVLPVFEGRILPIDAQVALRSAPLHIPDRRSDRDAFIAATALVHDMTVVTRNIGDFAGTGARLLNPWDEADRP